MATKKATKKTTKKVAKKKVAAKKSIVKKVIKDLPAATPNKLLATVTAADLAHQFIAALNRSAVIEIKTVDVYDSHESVVVFTEFGNTVITSKIHSVELEFNQLIPAITVLVRNEPMVRDGNTGSTPISAPLSSIRYASDTATWVFSDLFGSSVHYVKLYSCSLISVSAEDV